MTLYPGSVQSGGTFVGQCGQPRRLDHPGGDTTTILHGAGTVEAGTGPFDTIGPSGGTVYDPFAIDEAHVVTESDVIFTAYTNWHQQVMCFAQAPGPELYEPTTELADDPDALGWTYPGSDVMHLDFERCRFGTPHDDYEEWQSAGGNSIYTAYRRTHYATIVSATVDMYVRMSSRNMYTGSPYPTPVWAQEWEIGVPASVHVGPRAVGEEALHMSSLTTPVSGATYSSVPAEGMDAVHHSFPLTWPTTTVPGWGDIIVAGLRFTGMPVSAADLDAWLVVGTVYVSTGPLITATATKSPFQLLYGSPVVPTGLGVLKTKVSDTGLTEEERWQSWGFPNETAGAGKVMAGDGWHVADDTAPVVSGHLKIKNQVGEWQHVSWMSPT